MTAPFNLEPFMRPLPVPDVRPGPMVPPAPGIGQTMGQVGGDLAAVLQALQNASIQSRQVANQYNLGMAGVGQQQNELLFKQALEAAAQELAAREGQGWASVLSGSVPGVQGIDPRALPKMVGQFKDLGIGRGPLTTEERNFGALQGMDPEAGVPDFRRLIMPVEQKGTTVNVSTGEKFGGALATGRAQQTLKAMEDSRATAAAFDRDERIIRHTKNAITGKGANTKLQAARLAQLFGLTGFKNEVEATQLLQAEASQVVGQMVTEGLMGRGNLNPVELERLVQMAGGDISLEAGTIDFITTTRYRQRIDAEQERINQLRQLAMVYPDEAAQLNADADRMERDLRPRRARLAALLQKERVTDLKAINEQRKKYGLPPIPSLPGTTP